MAGTPSMVGQSPPRKEGRAKVLGHAQYVDDITLPGMWYGATVRSTIPRGRNTFKSYLMQKNQTPISDEVWENADFIVEGEYRTGAQEQLYIENNGVIAEYDLETGVTVRGSMQCPFYLVHALTLVFNLPAEKC